MFRPSLLPVLVYRDGAAAIDWLVRAFGLEELRRVQDDDGAILHAELRWRHGAAMITSLAADDDGSLAGKLGAGWVWAVVDDVDAHHRRAVAAGAHILIAPRPVGPEARSYRALDVEGNRWTFSTHGPALPLGAQDAVDDRVHGPLDERVVDGPAREQQA